MHVPLLGHPPVDAGTMSDRLVICDWFARAYALLNLTETELIGF